MSKYFAQHLFTDRSNECRHFVQALNNEKPYNKILLFHGDGERGKSWLLNMLQAKFCYRVKPADWEILNAQTDDNTFVEEFLKTEIMTQVPSVALDFGADGINVDDPKKDWSGLKKIREELGKQKLYFPYFDYGIVLFLTKTERKTKEELNSWLPHDESDFAAELINAVTDSPAAGIVKSVINLFIRHMEDRLALFMASRGLDKNLIAQLDQMDAETELRDRLPILLAQDLNASLELHEKGEHSQSAPRRVALFFDTYDAFWGHERISMPLHFYFRKDEWVRRFLKELYEVV